MNKAVEEILKQYPYIGEDIQKAQAELNRYFKLQQEARDPLKGQVLTDMPHLPAGNNADQTFDQVAKIIDLYQVEIDKYVKQINELIDLKKWLDKAFASLTEDERRIVYMHYDKRTSINKLAYTMRCSRHTIYKMLDEIKFKVRRII